MCFLRKIPNISCPVVLKTSYYFPSLLSYFCSLTCVLCRPLHSEGVYLRLFDGYLPSLVTLELLSTSLSGQMKGRGSCKDSRNNKTLMRQYNPIKFNINILPNSQEKDTENNSLDSRHLEDRL